MRIRGGGRQAFYILPIGGECRHDRSSAGFRRRHDSTLYSMLQHAGSVKAVAILHSFVVTGPA